MESSKGSTVTGAPWALKEWSVVCQAMAAGQQTLTLRKGGIEEGSGEFRAEHSDFLLFPTTEHQKREALRPEAEPFWPASLSVAENSADISFTLYARCLRAARVPSRAAAQSLAHFTVWTPEYLGERFDLYPGKPLLLLVLRLYRLPRPLRLPRDPSYAGCRSWVPLIGPPTLPEGLEPVLSDEAMRRQGRQIDGCLAGGF